jgi:uncharacterized protein DUF6160
MKKLGFLTAAIWVLSLLIIPHSSSAKMTVMTDNELKTIAGQAGITIQPEDIVGLDINTESLSYTDQDSNAWFALCDTTLQGSVEAESIDYDFISQPSSDGYEVAGVSFNLKNVEVNIDHFQTDMRLGDENGSDSLGLFGIVGMKARISGNVRIYARQ